jgi:hypothetical protein
MHDIRAIRDNPEAFVAGWSSRGVDDAADVVARILALDVDLRAAQTRGQDALAKRNAASKAIGAAMGKKDMAEADRLKAEVEALKGEIAEAGDAETAKGAELRDLLAGLKNLAAADVPDGEDENGNVEVLKWGEPRTTGPVKDHADLGEALGLLDFEAAAKMSGSRFAVLKGQLARLERAIGQFMLDLQTDKHGYQEVAPPYMVKDDAMFGTGQLPKFEEDLFRAGEHLLIPYRRSLPDQPRARADPVRGRGRRAHALDRPDAVLPSRGRFGGARYARPDPPASVLQGRDGLHLPSRGFRGRARTHDRLRRGGASGAGAALSQGAAVQGRHGLLGAEDL